MRKITIAAAIGAMLAGPANAGGAVTVIGITLGQPISLPECVHDGKTIWGADHSCWSNAPYPPGMLDLWLKNDGPFGLGRAFARIENGGIVWLDFGTLGAGNEDHDLALLIHKFGQPTIFRKTQMQNNYGAQFLVGHAEWRLNNVVVIYDIAEVDSGDVAIYTPGYYAEEQKKRAKNSGGGL